MRAVCRDPAKGRFLEGAEIVPGDVQDADAMQRYAQGCDVVFHVAAVSSGSAAVHYRVNVQGAENVAEAAYAAGASRLVHVSSVAAYGLHVRGDVFESQPQRPSTHEFYQQTKSLGEAAVWRIAQRTGLPTSVVRPAYVYGPRSTLWTTLLLKWCRQLPLIPDFGAALAHPIYIDDLVDLMLHLATHPAAPGQAFNASADPPVTWNTFLGYYARMADKTRRFPIPVRLLARMVFPPGNVFDQLSRLSGEPSDLGGLLWALAQPCVYRMQKAADLLDWRPRVSLAEGMAAIERWYAQNPEG